MKFGKLKQKEKCSENSAWWIGIPTPLTHNGTGPKSNKNPIITKFEFVLHTPFEHTLHNNWHKSYIK